MVPSKKGTVQVGELQVDVVCSNFGERTFLLVTHLNKIGTLLQVSRDALLSTSSTTYSVHTLLGKDEVEVQVFGRAIAESLSLPPNMSLLLGLGFKDHTPSLLNSLLPQLKQFRTWK